MAKSSGVSISPSRDLVTVPLAVRDCSSSVLGTGKISLTIGLPEATLVVANVPVMILKGTMDYMLIGSDVLERLSIDPMGSLNSRIKGRHYDYVFDFLDTKTHTDRRRDAVPVRIAPAMTSVENV